MPQTSDIISFIADKNSKSFILQSRNISGRWRNRLLALWGGFTGGYGLSDMFYFLLPTSLRPLKVRRCVWDNFIRYTNQEARKAIAPYINNDGSVALYGKPFFVPFENYEDFIDVVEQVIVSDQYYAKKFLKNDSVVIDAGANMGVFSVFAAKICQEGTIYGFEPSSYTFEILSKNTAPYPNVKSTLSGLGDVATQKNILIYPNSTVGNIMEDSARASFVFKEHIEKSESVKIIKIDDFVEQNNIKKIDFIKIDTEGYEARILNGAAETIKKFKPVIAMSAYHTPGDKEILPRIVKSISDEYQCDLLTGSEEEFICYIKTP
jgi:FkbM family methyltransferase